MTDKIERGIAAKAILENPTFREVINDLDAKYHALWREAKTVEAREDLHRYVKCLEHITDDLRSVATTGDVERARQKELEGKKSWLTK